MNPYQPSFLNALENWLNLNSKRRPEAALALRGELEDVEGEYKQCRVRCYRRIDFPKDPGDNPRGISTPLLNLLHTGQLEESVSSWTTESRVAMNHIEGVQKGDTCVIFAYDPKPEQVWVNLYAVLQSPRLASRPAAIQSWMTQEREVILEVPFLTPDNVYAWGGFVGSLEQLRLEAEILDCPPELVEKLESYLQTRGIKPGQEYWLSEERSRATAYRMQSFARERYLHPPPEPDTT
jgi:hypothetical protein